MNIILFTSSKNKSGGTRQALYLAQGLQERGHDVTFFLPEQSTLPEIAPDFSGFSLLKEPGTWRKSIEAAMPVDGSPCVIHAFHNAAVKRAAWWGLFWRRKAIVLAHRGVIFRPKNPLPYWSPGIDHFIVNSEMCAHVLHGMGVSEKRLSVVPNAVPEERITPRWSREFTREQLKLPDGCFVFGSVANNNPVKGVQESITAFAKHVAMKQHFSLARYLIVGVRPEKWQPLCQELNVEDKVILMPPTEDVASYLAAMDAFVLPSLSESMPNTLLEAIRMKLPAIGTKVGAVPQILDTCGLCVDPGDVSSLGNAMVRFLTDKDLVARFSRIANQEAVKYSPSTRLDTIEHIYSTTLQKKRLAP